MTWAWPDTLVMILKTVYNRLERRSIVTVARPGVLPAPEWDL